MKNTGKVNDGLFSLRSISNAIVLVAIILLLTIISFGILLSNTIMQINTCNDQLLSCSTDTREMDRAVFYLSRQAALYIQNHDQACMDNYFDDVEHQVAPILDELRVLGQESANTDALTAVMNQLDFMGSREVYAMRLAATANGMDESQMKPTMRAVRLSEEDAALSPEEMIHKARALMGDTQYAQAYNDLRLSLESFQSDVVNELEMRMQKAQARLNVFRIGRFGSMFLLLVLIIFTREAMLRGILRPLESCIKSIQEGQPFEVKGVHELQQMAQSYNAAYSRNVDNQEKLRVRAERDPMTGLLNQGNFGLLKQRLEHSQTRVGLMVIDVDYFKHINDAFGHEVGNQTLKKIATVLQTNFSPDDYVIRYGGDEFVVVMTNMTGDSEVALERKMTRINESLQQPEDGLPAVSLSIGASFSENGFHDTLFQQADQAMYEVKRKGRCGFGVYHKPASASGDEDAVSDEQNKQRILLVDDSEMNREILCSMLEDEYEVHQVTNGLQAIEEIGKKGYDFAAVLLDLVMPVCDGYEVLSFMKKHRWLEILPVIVISSETDPTCINRAYDMGAGDFISRPFDAQIVRRRVNNTVGLNLKYKRLSDLVTRKIQEKIEGYNMMLSVLSQVVEFRNHESGNHVLHIGLITEMLLDCLMKKPNNYGLTYEEAQKIRFASALHDIGKITIPDEIINKPGPLTPEERAIMETHAAAGADLLDQVEGFEGDPIIHRAWEICRWHHERYDGKGYPDGLAGDEIPISAQVVAMADVYDALTSERCYKPAFTHERAIEMILNGECGTFNPLLVECLREVADQFPSKLQEENIGHKWNRDASHMVEEISHLGELDISNKMMFQLQFEQSCADYFKQIVGGYTFSYRVDTDLLLMSPALAKRLNSEEVVHAPAQNDLLLSSSGKTETNWRALRTDTSAENPECTVEVTFGDGAQKQNYHCHVRTIWYGKETPQYLGMVGILIPA